MQTVAETFTRDSAYWGDRDEWYIAYSLTRDSDVLTQSNFYVMLAKLGGESDDVAIERASHWLCGWIDRLLVRPGSDAEQSACDMLESLEDYPVLDEWDLSAREYDEAIEVIKACGPSGITDAMASYVYSAASDRGHDIRENYGLRDGDMFAGLLRFAHEHRSDWHTFYASVR